MAKSKELNMKIPSVGDLFSTQEEREEVGRERVRDIPLEDIYEFPNHPFKVKMDEKNDGNGGECKTIWCPGSCNCST